MSPAIRRSIMPARTAAPRRSCASSNSLILPPEIRGRIKLVESGEARVEIAGQPPRGAAGEAQGFSLAPRGGERPVRRLAQDRRVVAVGDDQPGAVGAEAVAVERLKPEAGRHRP